MSVDEIIAQILTIRDQVAQLERQQEELVQQRAQLEASLMHTMTEMGMSGLKSLHGTVSLVKRQKPYITDFNELMKYVVESGNTQLLQKRLATKAYGELVESDVEIPGTGIIEEYAVSVRRA